MVQRRAWAPVLLAAVAGLTTVTTSSWLFGSATTFAFPASLAVKESVLVDGLKFAVANARSDGSAVTMYASGHNIPEKVVLREPKGMKVALLKKMPTTHLTIEEMMQRTTTVLIRNIGLRVSRTPLTTVRLMKMIGLRGAQLKYSGRMNYEEMKPALALLQSQKVICKIKSWPDATWEIHEAFREFGVPPVSMDDRMPWKMCSILKFERTKPPKYGPISGVYREPKYPDIAKR
mmetsp:Transcript_23774/g.80343  ORF Transcript_23774/g.80343 Transcript_23774/m.80343 type:complete len:233 (+) Transcript_23774:62-760(+)